MLYLDMADYHHYKRKMVDAKTDRVAVYEMHVWNLLMKSKLKEKDHDSSLIFEIKHGHGSVQFARVLARKRGLNEDVCAVALLLHDIQVGLHGKYKNHAKLGAEIASKMLDEIGLFSKTEKEQVIKIIASHSDKHIWTDDPYQEIGKDADIIDCFLYPNVIDGYKHQKTPEILFEYIKRARKVFAELGIPEGCEFDEFKGGDK